VGVLGPERLDRPLRGHGDLPGLPLTLREVVLAGADLDRGAPGPAFVVAVRDVELDVAEAEARVAVDRPEDVHAAEPLARWRVVYGDPFVIVERRLVVGRRRFHRIRPGGAVVIAARNGPLLAPALVAQRIREAGVGGPAPAKTAESPARRPTARAA